MYRPNGTKKLSENWHETVYEKDGRLIFVPKEFPEEESHGISWEGGDSFRIETFDSQLDVSIPVVDYESNYWEEREEVERLCSSCGMKAFRFH